MRRAIGKWGVLPALAAAQAEPFVSHPLAELRLRFEEHGDERELDDDALRYMLVECEDPKTLHVVIAH